MSGTGDQQPGPADRLTALGGVGRILADGLSLIAALLLFAMMLVTFFDVVGRYVFDSPLIGAFELTEVLLGLIVFAGLPIVTWRREHVTVDLVTSRLPRPPQVLLARTAAAVTALVLAMLAWRLGSTGRDLAGYGDATVFLGIPLGPVALAMAVLAAVATGVALVRAIRP